MYNMLALSNNTQVPTQISKITNVKCSYIGRKYILQRGNV